MRTELYWVDGPWRGKLALSARPRGGDWLADEVADWKSRDIGAVLSLLTQEEENDLDLAAEANEIRRAGIVFLSFPIPDRQVPRSEAKLNEVLTRIAESLSSGKNVLVHCRQGIGRTGLVAACLLITAGLSPSAAVDLVSAGRGLAVPETTEQRDWIERFAPAMMK